MSDDVTWWKGSRWEISSGRGGAEIPGDTSAADIVSRTGEEMPEVAHDEGRPITPTDPSSMPREDDHPGGLEDSPEFTDRPGQGRRRRRARR